MAVGVAVGGAVLIAVTVHGETFSGWMTGS